MLPAQTRPRRITPYCYNTNNGETTRTTLTGLTPSPGTPQNRRPGDKKQVPASQCVCVFIPITIIKTHSTGNCCLAVARQADTAAVAALPDHTRQPANPAKF